MSADSGKYRHRVRLEENLEQVDSNGETIQDPNTGGITYAWTPVGTYWASIEPLSAKEFIAAQSVQSQVTTRISMRKPARMDAAMRLVHMVNGQPGTVFNIHGILSDRESGLEYVTLPVSQGVNQSGQ